MKTGAAGFGACFYSSVGGYTPNFGSALGAGSEFFYTSGFVSEIGGLNFGRGFGAGRPEGLGYSFA